MTEIEDPFEAFRLRGQVAVVTGASSGLGVRFASVLAAAGAQVVVVARRADKLADTAQKIGALAISADVTREDDVERVVSQTLETYGSVDVLVNNAGISDHAPSETAPLSQFRDVLDVNLVAAYHLSQVVGRHMLERGSGSIVNVASVLGVVNAAGIPQAGYAASKAGLIHLSRELAGQWGGRGVRVNALCPGWFASELTADMFADDRSMKWIERQTAMRRAGSVAELDGALLLLASQAGAYLTGQALVVDGGFAVV